MSQRQFVLSTCGTSLLAKIVEADGRGRLTALANYRETELNPDDRAFIRRTADAATAMLDGLAIQKARSLCAELNALAAFYEGDLLAGKNDYHQLVHSDTHQGALAAECVATYLRATGLNAQPLSATGLRTSDPSEFKLALARLARTMFENLSGYRDHNWRIVFQLSGGYKAAQGFLQTVGMLFADEIVYIFEGTEHLLRIPRLPIDLEAGMIRSIGEHLRTFRRLAQSELLPANEVAGLPDLCIEVVGNDAVLSPWGELCWERAREGLYLERFWEPPSRKIRPSEAFVRQAAERRPEERRCLNERMDDLSTFLEKGTNLKRLDFKPLRGNPCPPSTHECDAWASGQAYRIFMHGEDGIWVLDRLGPGLH